MKAGDLLRLFIQRALSLFLFFTTVLITMAVSAQANTASSSWLSASPYSVPRIVDGDNDLSSTEHNILFRNSHSVFADKKCQEQTFPWELSYSDGLSACWYDTEIGLLSRAGYIVKPVGKPAAPFAGYGSEHFPTKNPNVIIEAVLDESGASSLRFWRTSDMEFNEVRPYGPEGPLFYELPQDKAHIVRTQDGSPYRIDANLFYSNVWYSSDASWMMISYDQDGYLDVFNLNDFSWRRIYTNETGFGYFAISEDGRYIVESVVSKAPYVIDTAFCEVGVCQSISLETRFWQSGVVPYTTTIPKFYDNETVGIYASGGSKYLEYIVQAPGSYHGSYLALGDSFASGEGAGNYTQPTNGHSGSNSCHVSRYSYAFLIEKRTGIKSVNVACSEAEIKHIASSVQYPKSNPQNAYVQDMIAGEFLQSEYIESLKPDMVTISIGGNDIGFSAKIRRCVGGVDTCFSTYEDRVEVVNEINRLYPRLVETYKKIKHAGKQHKTVYALGYPYILKDEGFCRGDVLTFNKEEITFSEQLINYLNSVIRQAADEAGVRYVDVSQALVGYRLCEVDRYQAAVNDVQIKAYNWIDYSVAESLHPNLLGHRLLTNEILNKTARMTETNPRANPDLIAPNSYDDLIILDKSTRSGRPIYDLYFSPQLALYNVFFVDRNVRQIVQSSLLAPSSTYRLYVESDPVLLGTYTSDSMGSIELDYKLPTDLEPGFHTLHLRGTGSSGQLIDLYRDIYVADQKSMINGSVSTPLTSISTASDTKLPEDLMMQVHPLDQEDAKSEPGSRQEEQSTNWLSLLFIFCSTIVLIAVIRRTLFHEKQKN